MLQAPDVAARDVVFLMLWPVFAVPSTEQLCSKAGGGTGSVVQGVAGYFVLMEK